MWDSVSVRANELRPQYTMCAVSYNIVNFKEIEQMISQFTYWSLKVSGECCVLMWLFNIANYHMYHAKDTDAIVCKNYIVD